MSINNNRDNNCGLSRRALAFLALGASAGFSIGAWALSRNINNPDNTFNQNIAYVAGSSFSTVLALGSLAAGVTSIFYKDRVRENLLRPSASAEIVFNPNPYIQGQDLRNGDRNQNSTEIFV